MVLGSGWHVFDKDTMLRATMKNSEILIVNPTNSDMESVLNLVLSSAENKKTMVVSVNNEKLNTFDIPAIPIDIEIENLILKPGINVVTLDTNQFSPVYFGIIGTEIEDMKELTLSFHVQSISIMN